MIERTRFGAPPAIPPTPEQRLANFDQVWKAVRAVDLPPARIRVIPARLTVVPRKEQRHGY